MTKKQDAIIYVEQENTACPNSKSETWNQHPRVYLNIKKKEVVKCPYCGTIYKLKEI